MPPKAAASKPKAGSSDHASYQDMITDAIVTLKDRNGSSRIALKKYVKANNTTIKADDKMFDSLFNRALKAGVEKGVFAQPKGSSGGTKLAKKEAKPAAVKATKPKTEKKTAVAKPKKAAAPKKTAAATTKPKAAPKAKTTAAKPSATKPKAAAKPKKAAAPKAAPAVVDKPAVLGKTKSGRVTKTAPKATGTKKAAPKKKAAAAPAKA